MYNDAADKMVFAIAAAISAKFGVRAQRFAVDQITKASDESVSTWLAVYMALSGLPAPCASPV